MPSMIMKMQFKAKMYDDFAPVKNDYLKKKKNKTNSNNNKKNNPLGAGEDVK